MTANIKRGIIKGLDSIVHFDKAYAHCDIPCGIYDPHTAQIAAHTVIRMIGMINDIPKENPSVSDRENFVRCVNVKEEHAELCKREIRVLWGDYFKPEHAKAYPELNDLVWNALKQASKARQTLDMKNAEDLLESVEKIAEIFWKTKNVETVRAKSFYPTERTFVYPKIK